MSICIDMCKIVHTEGDSIFFHSSGSNQEALKKGISICNHVIVDGLRPSIRDGVPAHSGKS